MPRLVWFVLKDGRSVVAGCGSATKDTLERALAAPEHTLTLTTDDHIDRLASRDVRNFVLFDMRQTVPPASTIYRLVHV
ncbi:MAG TPA: hypothetical protein VFN10_04665 [Thermoanaerobaculia bacterium]|nr:hypothetical protein [Thermoanaerobaculia bacterium]